MNWSVEQELLKGVYIHLPQVREHLERSASKTVPRKGSASVWDSAALQTSGQRAKGSITSRRAAVEVPPNDEWTVSVIGRIIKMIPTICVLWLFKLSGNMLWTDFVDRVTITNHLILNQENYHVLLRQAQCNHMDLRKEKGRRASQRDTKTKKNTGEKKKKSRSKRFNVWVRRAWCTIASNGGRERVLYQSIKVASRS